MPVDPPSAADPSSGNGANAKKKILVIDTDPGVRWSLEKGLSSCGFSVETASMISQVLPVLYEEPVDAIIMELLPDAGLTTESLATLVSTPHAPRVICISIDSSPQTVIECMRRGAADFLMKPFSLAEVRSAVSIALERGPIRTLSSPVTSSSEDANSNLLIGVSQSTQELRKIVQQAARTDLNCLIRGESGVGKDLVAREIHQKSQRHDRPFVKVNCGALPENLLESELFGYEKGAFTGAYKSKPGRFSIADSGIIFLDEIGDMDPGVQVKLLQVIEHKEFTKIGGRHPINVDVQIIAATNSMLEEKIAQGTFRDDLYFRLNEVYIWVPSLRDRREDVPLLVHHFLRKHKKYSQTEKIEVSGDDLETLSNYEWPGNVRELESTTKRWLALGSHGRISDHTQKGAEPPTSNTPPRRGGSQADTQRTNSDAPPNPEHIFATLEDLHWNRRKAAELLGMSYSTLRRSIEKHGLDTRRSN